MNAVNPRPILVSGIVIKDDLTKSHVSLLKLAVLKYGRQHVWSSDGTIFASVDGIKKNTFRRLPIIIIYFHYEL